VRVGSLGSTTASGNDNRKWSRSKANNRSPRSRLVGDRLEWQDWPGRNCVAGDKVAGAPVQCQWRGSRFRAPLLRPTPQTGPPARRPIPSVLAFDLRPPPPSPACRTAHKERSDFGGEPGRSPIPRAVASVAAVLILQSSPLPLASSAGRARAGVGVCARMCVITVLFFYQCEKRSLPKRLQKVASSLSLVASVRSHSSGRSSSASLILGR
jgi:hypothetical protein